MGAALMYSAHARTWIVRAASLAFVPVCGAAIYMSYSRAGFIGAALTVLFVLMLSAATAGLRSYTSRRGSADRPLAAAVITASPRSPTPPARRAPAPWCWRWWQRAPSEWRPRASPGSSCAATKRWRLPRRTARIAVVAGVLIVLVALPTAGHSAISRAGTNSGTSSSRPTTRTRPPGSPTSNGNRYFIWRSSVRAFEHKPIKGTGAGTFQFWWSYTGGDEFLRDAHSIYLEPFAEGGILGGLLTLTCWPACSWARCGSGGGCRYPGLHAALIVPFLRLSLPCGAWTGCGSPPR